MERKKYKCRKLQLFNELTFYWPESVFFNKSTDLEHVFVLKTCELNMGSCGRHTA